MKDRIKQKLTIAKQYIDSKNYVQAEKCLLEIKDETIYACYMLDDLYQELGKDEESLKLEIECANKGYIKFIDTLRVYYLIKYDLEKTYKYTLMGVKKNDPYSIYYLADSYFNGTMTEVDYKKAYDLYLKFFEVANKKRKNSLILLYRMKAACQLLNMVEKKLDIIGNDTGKLTEIKSLDIKCTNDYYDYIFLKNKFDYITKDIEATSVGGITLAKIGSINNPNYIFDEQKEMEKYLTKQYYSHIKVLNYLENNYFCIKKSRLINETLALYNVFNYLHQKGYDNRNIINDDKVLLDKITKKFMNIFKANIKITIQKIKKEMNLDLIMIAKLLNHLINIDYIKITADGEIIHNTINIINQ